MKKLYLCLFLTTTFICLFTLLLYPQYREALLGEDMIVEDLTAMCFLCAALLSIYFLTIVNIRKNRKVLIFIAFAGLLAFLDELSFGERIFHLTMPAIGNKKIDGVHDFFKLAYIQLLKKFQPVPRLLLAIIALIILAAVIVVAILYRKKLHKIYKHIVQSTPWLFVFICSMLLLAAQLLDLDIIYFDSLEFFEETFELNAGLSLLLGAFSAYKFTSVQQLNKNPELAGPGLR